MLKALSLFLGLLWLASAAQAGYFVTLYGNQSFSSRRATHFVVAGNGSELNTLFQYTAASKAMKLQEIYPQDQVVLIAYNQTPGEMKNRQQLQSWGFQIIGDRSQLTFTPQRLLQEFQQVSQIASIDLYNHNAGLYGSSLENGSNRISQDTPGVSQLRSRMTATSYVILHGCNSGFYFAPAWARILGVPVAGSFTSTKFERLHENGQFYSYQDDLMPKEGDWTATNTRSFPFRPDCRGAGCLRMKPDNWPYTGMWGDYNEGGGLPFYKFFCVGIKEDRCLQAMAQSVFGLISVKDYTFKSSYGDYKNLVKDFLCPISATSNIRQQCSTALDRAEAGGSRAYNPYQGKMLNCDFNGCQAEIRCESDGQGYVIAKSCVLDNYGPAQSTAFVDEYLTYLKAYKYLNQAPRRGIFDWFH